MSNDGGSAFPVPTSSTQDHGFMTHNCERGMTLRDYFAAKAMHAAMAGAVLPEESWPEMLPHLGRIAYAIADAMLKAREQ
jgi:hypothetical protein